MGARAGPDPPYSSWRRPAWEYYTRVMAVQKWLVRLSDKIAGPLDPGRDQRTTVCRDPVCGAAAR